MRSKGKLIKWDGSKGFGFLAPMRGKKHIFIHRSGFYNRSRMPVEGDIVTYELGQDDQGRQRAINATFTGEKPPRENPKQSNKRNTKPATYLSVVFFAILIVLWLTKHIVLEVVMAYLAITVVTFFAYVFDKSKAENGQWRTQWRTPESTLHLLSLFGGWPGAAFAQHLLRHKSAKSSFRAGFWVTIMGNITALVYFIWPY